MDSNPVQKAVEFYAEVVQEATKVYEDTLRKAELDLRTSLGTSNVSGPSTVSEDVITMKKSDYDKLQVQLSKVADFIKKHPELN